MTKPRLSCLRALAIALSALFVVGGAAGTTSCSGTQTESSMQPSGAHSVFPIVIEPTQAMVDGAAAAHTQSLLLDAKCAQLNIHASMAALRPNGVGCPRNPLDREGPQ